MENIYIDKEISENIDIDKISNQLEFGISNRANFIPNHHNSHIALKMINLPSYFELMVNS